MYTSKLVRAAHPQILRALLDRLGTGVPEGSQNPSKSVKIPTSFLYPQNQEKVNPGLPKASQNDAQSLPRDT